MPNERKAFTFYFSEIAASIKTEVRLFSAFVDESEGIMTNAIWDTGAMVSAITPEMAKRLNVKPLDSVCL